MSGVIKVSTDQVAEIAKTIESLNKRAQEMLYSGRDTVKDLASSWEGEAASATIDAFSKFAAKYIDDYYAVIDSYVKFLRQKVAEGYFETETDNTNLADAFK